MYVHKGVSQSGISLVGPYENTDEIEDLVKAFRSEILSTRHESVDESEAEGKFDDLYKVRFVRVSVCLWIYAKVSEIKLLKVNESRYFKNLEDE